MIVRIGINEIPIQVVNWLNAYTGDFFFYKSLRSHLDKNGWLSELQIQRVEEAIERDRLRAIQVEQPATKNFSYAPGDMIQINAWLARKLAHETGNKVFFQKLEIVEMVEETNRAIMTKVKFVSCLTTSCNICGLPLDTEVSRACGIGPICAKRIGIDRPDALSAPILLMLVEAFAKKVGTVGPVWIPKSKIKGEVILDNGAKKITDAQAGT